MKDPGAARQRTRLYAAWEWLQQNRADVAAAINREAEKMYPYTRSYKMRKETKAVLNNLPEELQNG